MSLQKGLQYRTAAWAGIATQFFWGFMYLMIFEAFYEGNPQNYGISYEQLVQVLWLQQSFLIFIMLWMRDNTLFEMITNGNIAYELCRPLSVYKSWFAQLTAKRVAGATLRCLPIFLFAMLLPAPYTLHLPPDGIHFVLFLVTLILGLLLVVSISMIIYISVFYTLSPAGSLLLVSVIADFCSGMLIPIPFLPEGLKTIMYILPFRYTADLPFRLYAGHIGVQEGLFSILIQLIWLSVLLILGNAWMKKALKQVIVQGG